MIEAIRNSIKIQIEPRGVKGEGKFAILWLLEVTKNA